MNFNQETQKKIDQFAKEQSKHYLETAEMTYMEKLRNKVDRTKLKVTKKLSRFKNYSDYSIEAQNDMVIYMSDYMNDLMSKGMSENEAFDKAKEELTVSGDSDYNERLMNQISQYYENHTPTNEEAIGMFYGGFLFLGIAIGAIIGFINSGGREAFMLGGWIDTLLAIGVGALIGMGVGSIFHGFVVLLQKK